MVRTVLIIVLSAAILGALLFPPELSCAPKSGPETVGMTLGGKTFKLEVARTELQIETGLMFRKTIPADTGMIFVFKDEIERSFWMKNCPAPIDVIFVNSDQKIVSIRNMKPFDETGIPSDGPARWAIELAGGRAGQLGLKAGDAVEIPGAARAK